MIDWIKPKTATVPELAAQLERARERLAVARRDVERAVALFDDDPDSGAVRGLAKARATQDEAQAHVERAERLLAAARQRDDVAERQAAEVRLVELEAQLAHHAVAAAAAPLDEREAGLLMQIAALRAERLKLVDRFLDLGHEREQLLARVGRQGHDGVHVGADGVARTGRPRGFQGTQVIQSRSGLIDSLQQQLLAVDDDDARADALAEIITTLGGAARRPRRFGLSKEAAE